MDEHEIYYIGGPWDLTKVIKAGKVPLTSTQAISILDLPLEESL